MRAFTEEFHRILIATKEKVASCINFLRPRIQEEMVLLRVLTMEDAYQIALKVE